MVTRCNRIICCVTRCFFSKHCPAAGHVVKTVWQLRDKLCYPPVPNSLKLNIIENYVDIVVTVASPVPSSNRIYVGVVAETLPALRLLRPLMSLLSGVPGNETSTCTWRSCASSSCSSSPVNTGDAIVIKKQNKTINDSQKNLLQWKSPYGHLIMATLFTPVRFLTDKKNPVHPASPLIQCMATF